MAPPTSSTIALPVPSGMQKCTVTHPAPKQCMPGPYKAFNAAIDTAQASGSKPTIQTVKTLEQRITDTYLESPWAKVSHISDVEDSNTKMHAPQGKEDQGDWVFEEADEADKETSQETGKGEEADPSFVPLSPLAEPLDWGSDFDDGEVCVCPSYLPCLVHNLTELCQLLKKRRCMAGTSKGHLVEDEQCSRMCQDRHSSFTLNSSVNVGTLKCEHGQLYAFCGRCEE
jgi:hypothetical protein